MADFLSDSSDAKKTASTFSPIDLTNLVNSQLTGIGTAESVIRQHVKGKILINGCWWTALNVNNTTIYPGESVSVVGRQQNTLFVKLSQVVA